MTTSIQKLDEFSRRHLVESLAKTAFGVSILPAADELFGSSARAANVIAQAAKAEHVVYLFMNGAMSHIDTWDPKPGKEEGFVEGKSTITEALGQSFLK